MTDFVTSADGTSIAFDRLGDGPPVVVVGGLFCDRQRTHDLAEQLAKQLAGRFSVVNYDRRGRGDSTDTAPVRRRAGDRGHRRADRRDRRRGRGLRALLGRRPGAAGGRPRAADQRPRAARAALRRPTTRTAPAPPHELAARVRTAIAGGRPPRRSPCSWPRRGRHPTSSTRWRSDPRFLAVAPTMPYDQEVMGDEERGGTIPVDLVRTVTVPTLVIAGGASPAFFRDTAARLAQLLPNASLATLDGGDHDAPADVVAPVVAAHLLASPR